MTFNEYKEILEKNGLLDGYAHGLLAAFELGYGQGIVDGKKHAGQSQDSDDLSIAYMAGFHRGKELEHPKEPSADGLLFAVEQAIKNGDCPWQIEQAFDEYEEERKAAIAKATGETK